jgi:hypothetical protein
VPHGICHAKHIFAAEVCSKHAVELFMMVPHCNSGSGISKSIFCPTSGMQHQIGLAATEVIKEGLL